MFSIISVLGFSQKEKSLTLNIISGVKLDWKVEYSYYYKGEKVKKVIINSELHPNYIYSVSASKEIVYPSDCGSVTIDVYLNDELRRTSSFTFKKIKNDSQLQISGAKYFSEEGIKGQTYVDFYLLEKGKFSYE